MAVAVAGVVCGGVVALGGVLAVSGKREAAKAAVAPDPEAVELLRRQSAAKEARDPVLVKLAISPAKGAEGKLGKPAANGATMTGAGGGLSTVHGANGLGADLGSALKALDGAGRGNSDPNGVLGGSMKGDAHGFAGLGLSGTGSGGGGLSGVGAGGGGSGQTLGGMGAIGTKGRGGGSLNGAGLIGALGSSGGNGYASGYEPSGGGESYGSYGVNPFVATAQDPLSTFGVDVDTASYTVARRKLLEGSLPPPDSVRVEEFLNYFRYQYPHPEKGVLAVQLDAAPSPFDPGRHLLRVGVQGKRLSIGERKPAHLTFLVDVSGSMSSPDKLPLAKRALRTLVDALRDGDTVALVTYASGTRVVLPATGLEHKARLHAAIEDLTAGGSTAMAGGIGLAYREAMKTLDGKSVSRVIILSDGDANIGATSHEAMFKQIEGYAKEGVTVSTVGFGMGNYKDELMEQFANKGNGNHSYVDSAMEARRLFQEQLGGTLEVIAKDVKLQVEFDPRQVLSYRLVGYENRAIADEDFRNDRVDAGEIGAGHTVTALYELELRPGAGAALATVRVRAKRPNGSTADEASFPFPAHGLAGSFGEANRDLRFATAVMGAAEIFRRSPHARSWSYDQVLAIARDAAPESSTERQEFVELLQTARAIVTRVASR
ncbi:MAG: vWA domain-containing protein [Myxococcaceae bacterium]